MQPRNQKHETLKDTYLKPHSQYIAEPGFEAGSDVKKGTLPSHSLGSSTQQGRTGHLYAPGPALGAGTQLPAPVSSPCSYSICRLGGRREASDAHSCAWPNSGFRPQAEKTRGCSSALCLSPRDNLTFSLAPALSSFSQTPSSASEMSLSLRNVSRCLFSGRWRLQHLWHISISCQTGTLLMPSALDPWAQPPRLPSPTCRRQTPGLLFHLPLHKRLIGHFQVLLPRVPSSSGPSLPHWPPRRWSPPSCPTARGLPKLSPAPLTPDHSSAQWLPTAPGCSPSYPKGPARPPLPFCTVLCRLFSRHLSVSPLPPVQLHRPSSWPVPSRPHTRDPRAEGSPTHPQGLKVDSHPPRGPSSPGALEIHPERSSSIPYLLRGPCALPLTQHHLLLTHLLTSVTGWQGPHLRVHCRAPSLPRT